MLVDTINYDIFDRLHEGAYILDKNRKIMYWNKGAESISGYTAGETIGKSCSANLLVHIDQDCKNLCQSECPVLKSIIDGRISEADVYLHHKKGHRVPVSVRVIPIEDKDGNRIGAVEFFIDSTKNFMDNDKLKELVRLSFLDHVTGLYNRRYLETKLESVIDEYKKTRIPLGIIMLEIRNLRDVYSKHGDVTGDKFTKAISNSINSNSDTLSICGRWSESRFIIILPNTKKSIFQLYTEKLRGLVGQSYITVDNSNLYPEISYGGILVKPEDSAARILTELDELIISFGKA